MILYIVLWIVNMLFVINKKYNNLICIVTYLILGVLFVTNTGSSGDAFIYREHFEDRVFFDDTFEVGYTFVEKALHACGIHTYTGLLIVLFILGTIFLWIGLKEYSVSYHYVLSIIMPFIFPTYATAIRFFLASTVIVAAIRFLNEKKYYIFFILVVFASSFHIVTMFYIVFMFCNTRHIPIVSRNKKFLLWFVAIFSTLNFGVSIIVKKNPLILALMKTVGVFLKIDENKMTYANTHTNLGGLIFLFIYFCGLITASYIYREILNKRKWTDKDSKQITDVIKIYGMVNYNMNLVLSVILTFVGMNLLFYRLLIIGHISNAIALGMFYNPHLSKQRIGGIQINLANLFFVLSCFAWLIPEIVGINGITIKGLFESSILFG